MIRSSLTTAALCCGLAAPAIAADPAFDCTKAESAAETAICADEGLAGLDRELARLYGLAAGGPQLGADRLAELKAMQRGWIKGRDECWKADVLERCVADEYALRIHALRQGYADARSEDAAGISVGPLALACDGLDAGVSLVFVNGDAPMASLLWRDQALVLDRVPAGSGERYEGASYAGAGMLWTQGDAATLMLPGGSEVSCRFDETG